MYRVCPKYRAAQCIWRIWATPGRMEISVLPVWSRDCLGPNLMRARTLPPTALGAFLGASPLGRVVSDLSLSSSLPGLFPLTRPRRSIPIVPTVLPLPRSTRPPRHAPACSPSTCPHDTSARSPQRRNVLTLPPTGPRASSCHMCKRRPPPYLRP